VQSPCSADNFRQLPELANWNFFTSEDACAAYASYLLIAVPASVARKPASHLHLRHVEGGMA